MISSTLTVGELASLTDPPMQPLAGTAGLANGVTWVVSTEHLAPTDWLRGGEFMLISGWNFRPSGASMRNYVRRISHFGLSGLGFAVGFRFKRVPEPILEEAERQGFPVLEVPFELAFADIARAAAEVLFKRDRGSLAAIRREHIELANGLVAGTLTTSDVLMKAASYLRGSAVLHDREGQSTMSHFVRERQPDPSRLKKIERRIGAAGGPVRLEIWRDDDQLSEIEELFLEEVCLALSFDSARKQAVDQTRLQLESDLLHELASGAIDVERARSKFVAFGLDPSRRFGALVVREAIQPERMKAMVMRALGGSGAAAITAKRALSFEAVVDAASDDSLHRLGETLALGVPSATVGIGRVGPFEFVGHSLVQARHLSETRRIGIVSVRELGANELLMAIDQRVIASYVERTLGAIEDADLLATVEALLEAGFNWNEAAARIGVHRHTLRYRVGKFVDATGIDIADPGQRLQVWLALKGKRILRTSGYARS